MNKPLGGITMERAELLKRLSKFKNVPGHGPKVEQQSNKELGLYVNLIETMSKKGIAKLKESKS